MIGPVPRAALAAVVAAALLPTTAWADHTYEARITDLTAYSLNDSEWRVGLWKIEYGLTEDFTVGTYTAPWALKVISATTKWNFWTAQQEANQLAAGVRVGFYSLDLERLDGPPGSRINIVPVELIGSYRRNTSMSLHGGFIFSKVSISGSPGDSLRGAAAGDSTQLFGQIEWRWGRHTAFLSELRVLTSQKLTATTDVTVPVDEFTTLRVAMQGGGDVADSKAFKGAAFLSAAFLWSWGGWNVKAGLGYGNIPIPAVNMMLPAKSLFPDIDIYYRF